MSPIPETGHLFKVSAGFLTSAGSYVCRIDPVSDTSGFVSGEVELLVRPGIGFSSGGAALGDVVTLPFVSGFKVRFWFGLGAVVDDALAVGVKEDQDQFTA